MKVRCDKESNGGLAVILSAENAVDKLTLQELAKHGGIACEASEFRIHLSPISPPVPSCQKIDLFRGLDNYVLPTNKKVEQAEDVPLSVEFERKYVDSPNFGRRPASDDTFVLWEVTQERGEFEQPLFASRGEGLFTLFVVCVVSIIAFFG
ncbi:MAG: hypothetical protein Q8Q18_01310 [bacterium]|nr:hypothetical protein [bacterium]